MKIRAGKFYDDKGRAMPQADFIKELRRRHRVGTRELADVCGVSPRTVEGWEQGRPMSKAALKLLDLTYRKI